MMKKQVSLFGLMVLLWVTVWAQADTLYIPSMKEVRRQNLWLSSLNPVGLSMNRFRSFSIAEAEYSYNKGNFGQITLPTAIQSYRIYCESLQKIRQVSLYGKLVYANNDRRQQNWDGMSGDYWQAVNLCDSISGNQHTELYQLSGGFALPLCQSWQIGAAFNYLVQQTAKETDPRNSNQWMTWIFTPGVSYRHSNLRLGASLRYASRKETVDIRNMGTHATYPIFAAYPLGFFKTLPQSDNPNWHYTGDEKGAALQLEINKQSIRLFQQFNADIIHQQIESNRAQNRCEGETDGWQMAYRVILQQQSLDTRHEWDFQTILHCSNNYDPLQYQATDGPWQSYGRVLRSNSRTVKADFTYHYDILRNSWNSRFSLLTGANYLQEKESLLFYPAEFTQLIRRFTVHTTLSKYFVLPHLALFNFSIGGHYGKGRGTPLREKQLPNSEQSQDIRLWQNTELRQQSFEYRTASRWGMKISATYTHKPIQTNLSYFFQLSGEYEQIPENQLPTDKKKLTACIGLLF